MAGTGTGYPFTLRCAKCKRHRDWRSNTSYKDERLEATGRVKPLTGHAVNVRCVRYMAEYRCLNCGHVWWSKHWNMERLLLLKGFRVEIDAGRPKVRKIDG